MALTTITNEITFRFGESPKDISLTDTSDYAGQGVALADVDGIIKAVGPDGNTFYNNTDYGDPDVDADVSLTSSKLIALPLDSSGVPLQGNYEITYSVQDSSTATIVVLTKNFTLNYTTPEADIDMSVDCVKPELTSTDNTNYVVGGVTPTSITRDHDIQYPPSVSTPDVDGVSKTVSTSVFFTLSDGVGLQHSSSLTATTSYTYSNGFFITDTVTGNGYINVSCDAELCDVYCCLRAQYNRWQDATGTTEQQVEMKKFFEVMSIAELIEIALRCGKGGDVSKYVTELRDIANCQPGCGCGDGEPVLVTGLGGGSGSVVVASGGAPVVVTSLTVGSVTTYTVSLDPSFVSKVSASYNTVVAAGAGMSVAVATVGDTKTYTVTNTLSDVNMLTFSVSIDLTGVTPIPVMTAGDATRYGTAFDDGTGLTLSNKYAVASDWLFKNNTFIVDDIWDAMGGLSYKTVGLEITEVIDAKGITASTDYPIGLLAEYIDLTSTTLSFRFTDSNLSPVTGSNLQTKYSNIKVQITLIA